MQKFGAFVENGVFGYFRLVGFKWVRGKVPELQDHIGAVEIRKSEINGDVCLSLLHAGFQENNVFD